MAKGKQTVKAKEMLTWANIQLARTDDYATRDFKAGVCVMIEKVLFASNNYWGFRFLKDCEVTVTDPEFYSRAYSESPSIR
jgi:hypothetical protein